MGATPNLALPYPALTDAPNGPMQMQALANAVDALLGTPWVAYVPTLAQNGAAVAKSVGYARYNQVGKSVKGNVVMTPTAAGTTTTVINSSLPPVAPLATNPVIGKFWYLAASGARYEGVVIWTGGLLYFQAASGTNWFGASPAFAIASGDTFTFDFSYETT